MLNFFSGSKFIYFSYFDIEEFLVPDDLIFTVEIDYIRCLFSEKNQFR